MDGSKGPSLVDFPTAGAISSSSIRSRDFSNVSLRSMISSFSLFSDRTGAAGGSSLTFGSKKQILVRMKCLMDYGQSRSVKL